MLGNLWLLFFTQCYTTDGQCVVHLYANVDCEMRLAQFQAEILLPKPSPLSDSSLQLLRVLAGQILLILLQPITTTWHVLW